MRRILHMDMDAFFASVEEKRHPELKNKPLVIGGSGDPTQRGVVSTANYEARKYGIHSAMPLITAYKLCPHAVFLPVDIDEYSRVSELFKNILKRFSNEIEEGGIDEAFLDISDIETPSDVIAKEIKSAIQTEIGLTCSIGIAHNKLLAKLASDMQKPDGYTLISEGDIQTRIWLMPVRKLIGVGPKTEGYLKELSINTIGELASASLEMLIEHLGKSYGNYLYEASRGIDDSPIVTYWEPKSISRETTFQRDTNHWQTIAKTLADMTRETVTELKTRKYKCLNVTVKIRFEDFKTYTRAKTMSEQTNDLETIRRAAFYCFGNLELKKRVRLVGVRIAGLEKSDISR